MKSLEVVPISDAEMSCLAKDFGGIDPHVLVEMLKRLLSNRRIQIALIVLAGLTVIAAFIAWRMGVDLAALKSAWTGLQAWLVKNPASLFWALVLLPGLPVPTSALLFTAGVVWKDRPVVACLLCLLAMLLNLTWTYWLAAGPAHKLVGKLLLAGSFKIPEVPKDSHLRLVLILKLTPGIPFFVQNYTCGFVRAPFSLYLPISMVCNGIIGTGVVLSGVGLGDGKLVPALTGVSLIALGAVLIQTLRAWMGKRKRAAGS